MFQDIDLTGFQNLSGLDFDTMPILRISYLRSKGFKIFPLWHDKQAETVQEKLSNISPHMQQHKFSSIAMNWLGKRTHSAILKSAGQSDWF